MTAKADPAGARQQRPGVGTRMMRGLNICCAGLFAWFLGAAPGLANTLQTISFLYYPVSGHSPVEIYRSLVARGPHVGHTLAYATTTAHTTQNATLRIGQACSFSAYRLTVGFATTLPRLTTAAELSGGDLSRWRGFDAFVQQHEATHRSIWMGCAAGLETQLRQLTAPNCNVLTRQAVALALVASKACTRRHRSFDAAQQILLKRQPFILSVFRRTAR